MSSNNKLKRCGKKLPRHCDVNRDNKIGFTEWLNCLNVNHVQTQTQPNGTFFFYELWYQNKYLKSSYLFSESNTTIVAKRRGPNPLESYLKGDD